MSVTNNVDPGFIQNLPFKIAADSLKYLWVILPKNAKNIYIYIKLLNYARELET